MALGLRPQNALLGDVNPHTINFYQQLQRGLRISAFTMRNERQHYDRARTEFNRLVTGRGAGKKAAALFYYLNRTGFNGLCNLTSQANSTCRSGNTAPSITCGTSVTTRPR